MDPADAVEHRAGCGGGPLERAEADGEAWARCLNCSRSATVRTTMDGSFVSTHAQVRGRTMSRVWRKLDPAATPRANGARRRGGRRPGSFALADREEAYARAALALLRDGTKPTKKALATAMGISDSTLRRYAADARLPDRPTREWAEGVIREKRQKPQ